MNATIMEALVEDWAAAQSAAERALRAGSRSTAVREVQDFLKELSSVRVLDPACGTGNFLYVALRQMKQLEGEVLKQLHEHRLNATTPISVIMAIPHHPWTKAAKDSAAVRITMTVAAAGTQIGALRNVTEESNLDTDEPTIRFEERFGKINSDLTIGTDVTSAVELRSNAGLCSPGVKLHGDGFIIQRSKAAQMGLGKIAGLERHIRPYRNGRDLTSRSRDALVIDLFGLTAVEARHNYPEVYQHLLETVKPGRQAVFDKSGTRDSQEYLDRWWLFGKPRQELRPALEGLDRYIATVETAKHRIFQFLDGSIIPDNMLVVIASEDAFHLGVLSSRAHVLWTLASGGTLEDRPRYSKSKCFDPFPFPDATQAIRKQISSLANELDQIRKRVLADNAAMTLTGLYNVVEKIRMKLPLTVQDEEIKLCGLVPILNDLHHQIDKAVFNAYGWESTLNDKEVMEQLVVLNASRAAEERDGLTRWMRPEYQFARFGTLVPQTERVQPISVASGRIKPKPFPAEPKLQAGEVLKLLRRSERPLTPNEIASAFKPDKQVVRDIQDILGSLHRLGEARTYDRGQTYCAAGT